MDEGDLEAEHTVARRLVDQLRACIREMREGGPDVVHLVRDVVHPGPALREKAADRRVLPECPEELEPALADADRGGLDPLLVDARAVLQPGAEEALVRLESAVEILDRETDVMHRPRRLHASIVFERLATTMRAPTFALVLTVALVAGCGGHGKSAAPNGEASKAPARVLADARAAASKAMSAHVAGNVRSDAGPITLDLSTARGRGAKGSMSTNGLKFDLIRTGDSAYIRGSDEFYKHFAGSAIAQLLHGRWLKASVTNPRFRSLLPLTSVGLLLGKVSSSHGKLVNEGRTTYRGIDVVAIRDLSDNSRLYVAAGGTPYPVAIVGGKQGLSGTITFDDWNKHVSLSAPSGAIDISKLGG